jgi:hypothetical protein
MTHQISFYILIKLFTKLRASEGDVRNNKPLFSMVDNAGNVADGEIIRIPMVVALFCERVGVTPDQSAPMIALTPLEVSKTPL